MNAPALKPCAWCGEPSPTLYEHDDAELCGECLDAAYASDDCERDVDDAFNLGLSEVRR